MIVPVEVKKCRECPQVTNSVRMHDDPFSNPPLDNTWYCKIGGKLRIIENPNIIDESCKFNT